MKRIIYFVALLAALLGTGCVHHHHRGRAPDTYELHRGHYHYSPRGYPSSGHHPYRYYDHRYHRN